MITDDERAELEVEFRRKYRVCEKGHKVSISDVVKNSCWTCHDLELQTKCIHPTRRWYNPSNLPGDNRWECTHCGKSGLEIL